MFSSAVLLTRGAAAERGCWGGRVGGAGSRSLALLDAAATRVPRPHSGERPRRRRCHFLLSPPAPRKSPIRDELLKVLKVFAGSLWVLWRDGPGLCVEVKGHAETISSSPALRRGPSLGFFLMREASVPLGFVMVIAR